MKWLWLSSGVIVLDQLTKLAAVGALELHQPLAVLPSVNLTLTHNTGAAFSLLDQAGVGSAGFFAAIALVVSACIVVWLYRLPRGKAVLAAGLSLILAGALGNLWDRLSLGYVIDFIDLYYATWHWPAFNVADSAITIGAGLLIADAFSGPAER